MHWVYNGASCTLMINKWSIHIQLFSMHPSQAHFHSPSLRHKPPPRAATLSPLHCPTPPSQHHPWPPPVPAPPPKWVKGTTYGKVSSSPPFSFSPFTSTCVVVLLELRSTCSLLMVRNRNGFFLFFSFVDLL